MIGTQVPVGGSADGSLTSTGSKAAKFKKNSEKNFLIFALAMLEWTKNRARKKKLSNLLSPFQEEETADECKKLKWQPKSKESVQWKSEVKVSMHRGEE